MGRPRPGRRAARADAANPIGRDRRHVGQPGKGQPFRGDVPPRPDPTGGSSTSTRCSPRCSVRRATRRSPTCPNGPDMVDVFRRTEELPGRRRGIDRDRRRFGLVPARSRTRRRGGHGQPGRPRRRPEPLPQDRARSLRRRPPRCRLRHQRDRLPPEQAHLARGRGPKLGERPARHVDPPFATCDVTELDGRLMGRAARHRQRRPAEHTTASST